MATTVTAPVANSIALASKYLPILDEIYNHSELAVKEDLDEADTLLYRKFKEIRKQKYRGITSILG